ncbi:MAG: helix-turn-helix transcriptional regulator [Candidatus Binatia bacterium]
MSEPANPPTLLADALAAILKPIVKEAVEQALNGHRDEDRLLDAEEAAKLLGMSRYWLYRHAQKLPFTRKLGPKNLRFSYQGIQKWLATRKTS